VHVWQPSDVDDDTAVRDNDIYRRHLTERFHRFIESLALPATIEVKTEVREGRAAERLLDFAEAHRVDLIAIGRNGRRTVERLLIGGVAERVLRNARCSMLIAPDHPLGGLPVVDASNAASEQILPRGEWETTLDALARHNAGRVVSLDVDDPERGVASRERGYILFGLSFASRDRLVSIVLGDTSGRRQHRTWQVFDPRRISIARDAQGDLLELRIQHGDGVTLLSVGAHSS